MPNNQKLLNKIYKFLSLFKLATLEYKGNNATLNNILYIINFLILYLTSTKVSKLAN